VKSGYEAKQMFSSYMRGSKTLTDRAFLVLLWDFWPPHPPPQAKIEAGTSLADFPNTFLTLLRYRSFPFVCMRGKPSEYLTCLSAFTELGPRGAGAGARSIFPRACYRTTSSKCRCGVISSKHTLKLLPTSAVTFRCQLPAIIYIH
jgi:hypothetical protein